MTMKKKDPYYWQREGPLLLKIKIPSPKKVYPEYFAETFIFSKKI